MGGVSLHYGADSTIATVTQSDNKLDQNLRSFMLDSDVGKEIERLKAELLDLKAKKEYQAELDANPAPTGYGSGSFSALITHKELTDQTDSARAKLKAYSSPGGKRHYAVDQIHERLRSDPYINSFGAEPGLWNGTVAVGSQVLRGGIEFGSMINTGLIKGGGAIGGLPAIGVGKLIGSESLESIGQGALDISDQFAMNVNSGVEDWLDDNALGLERTALANTFGGNQR